jgi:hypothetical protein
MFDFLAEEYKSKSPRVKILSADLSKTTDLSEIKAQPDPDNKNNFVQRWYLSLQGEDSPITSETALSQEGGPDPRVYRYDWAFGMTLIEGFWWDWQHDLRDKDSAIRVHVVLKPIGDAPEVVPVGATLSALHPSKNTKSIWEVAGSKIPRTAAEMAKIGASALPLLNYASTGLMFTSNVLDSYTENQKNWFLYQFFDEKLKCPTVEWNINKQVIEEYGPLLRGTLFAAFYGSTKAHPGSIRVLLRPQVSYLKESSLDFVVPTGKLEDNQQVYLEIKPKDASASRRRT